MLFVPSLARRIRAMKEWALLVAQSTLITAKKVRQNTTFFNNCVFCVVRSMFASLYLRVTCRYRSIHTGHCCDCTAVAITKYKEKAFVVHPAPEL